jgi:hypothetical protein
VPEPARIVVRRPPGGARDLLRKYRIEIDGTRAGTVARGEAREFTVPAGTHRVRAGIDWAGSRPLCVELAPGEVAHLRVEPGGSALRVDQMFSTTSYLQLSAEEAADGAVTPEHGPGPRFSWIGLIGVPFALFGVFLVSYGVHGAIRHDRAYSWVAVVGGVLLYVVPLALARRARRRRMNRSAP